MKRFTILSLMGVVVVLAVGIAALRQANDEWAGGMLLATPLILSIALVGGLCGKRTHRARRLGFAVFGWAYFAVAFLGLSEANLGLLPSSKLCQYIHRQVVGTIRMNVRFTTGTIVTSGNSGSGPATINIIGTSATATGAGQVTLVESAASNSTPNRWKVILPGAANSEAFLVIGHCLFALMAGLLGVFVAVRFEKARLRESPEVASPTPNML